MPSSYFVVIHSSCYVSIRKYNELQDKHTSLLAVLRADQKGYIVCFPSALKPVLENHRFGMEESVSLNLGDEPTVADGILTTLIRVVL